MKQSSKAALYSALVFPGVGHFYLKRYIPGSIISGIAIICTYYIVSKAIEQAYKIVDQILSGAVQPDLVTITEMVTKQLAGSEGDSLNQVTLLLAGTWLVGIITAYLAGRSENESD